MFYNGCQICVMPCERFDFGAIVLHENQTGLFLDETIQDFGLALHDEFFLRGMAFVPCVSTDGVPKWGNMCKMFGYANQNGDKSGAGFFRRYPGDGAIG